MSIQCIATWGSSHRWTSTSSKIVPLISKVFFPYITEGIINPIGAIYVHTIAYLYLLGMIR